jgi:dolichol-phosphate mannosyltransferase
MSTLALQPITRAVPAVSTAIAKPTYPVSLGVIVPAYNEVHTIREILHRVYEALDGKFTELQVIVVDDASTDGTSEELIKIVQDNPRIELHTHEKNRGKGAAIRTALEHLHTDLVIIQDADLEYDPNDIPLLVEPLLAGEADIIFGSRVLPLPGGKPRPRRNIYGWGVWVLNCLIRLLYGYRLTDHATCYKLIRTADLKRMDLKCEGFEFCIEVIACLKDLKLSILEKPIQFIGRHTSDGKKISSLDFFAILGFMTFRLLGRKEVLLSFTRPRNPIIQNGTSPTSTALPTTENINRPKNPRFIAVRCLDWMRKFLVVVPVVLLLLMISLFLLFNVPVHLFSSGTLVLDKSHLVLDASNTDEPVSASVRLTNCGVRGISIVGARLPCRCIGISQLPVQIEPKATKTITLSVKREDLGVGEQNAIVELFASDAHPRILLDVRFISSNRP